MEDVTSAVLARLRTETTEIVSEADLPAFIGGLAEAAELAKLRLHTPVLAPVSADEPEHYIKPREAAEIAQVGTKTIYQWSKGQKWAVRPPGRYLRIREVMFRNWLRART